MVSIPTVIGILSCGFLLCLGLSTATQAEDMKAGQSERNGGQAAQQDMPCRSRRSISSRATCCAWKRATITCSRRTARKYVYRQIT